MSDVNAKDINWDSLSPVIGVRGPIRDSDHIIILSSETKKPYRARIRDLGNIKITQAVFTGTGGGIGGGGDGLSESEANNLYLRKTLNLSDLSNPVEAQANLKLRDKTANVDLNSIAVNGINIFPNNKPQGLDTDGNVQFNQIDLATKLELDDANGIINSETFASGFAGTGVRLDEGGGWNLTLDNLTVRQRMRVYELLISQIRATNGSIAVTSADRAESVQDLGGGSWRIFIEQNKFVPFLTDDLVISQRFTGEGTYLVEGTVTAVENGSATVTDNSTPRYFDITLETGSDLPQPGMEFIRWGNTSDPNRQGLLYLTSDDDDAPYMDIVYGVDSHAARNSMGTIKGRVGRLDGIIDSDFPTLDGTQTNEFGVYIDGGYFNNVEVRGNITVLGGNAETTSGAQAKVNSLQSDLDAILDNAVANGTTIISGGFIQTSLIDVDDIFAQNIEITGKLTNAGDDFFLNDTGLNIYESAGFSPSRSLSFLNVTNDAIIGDVWFDNSNARLAITSQVNRNISLVAGSQDRLSASTLIELAGLIDIPSQFIELSSTGILNLSTLKSSIIRVRAESGSTSDDLAEIRVNSAQPQSNRNFLLYLIADPGDTITIVEGNNIVTNTGDVVITDTRIVSFIYVNGNWMLLHGNGTI